MGDTRIIHFHTPSNVRLICEIRRFHRPPAQHHARYFGKLSAIVVAMDDTRLYKYYRAPGHSSSSLVSAFRLADGNRWARFFTSLTSLADLLVPRRRLQSQTFLQAERLLRNCDIRHVRLRRDYGRLLDSGESNARAGDYEGTASAR